MFRTLPPLNQELWNRCFDISVSTPSDDYFHLHFNLKANPPINELINELTPFYELAHKDAREKFNDVYGISLAPFNIHSPELSYPHSLSPQTKNGFFGEVFCAIVASRFRIHLSPNWRIPAFLFRHHQTAGEYLHRLGEGAPSNPSQIGRTGDDFLALTFDEHYRITNCLVSESKCHATFNVTHANEVFTKISSESINPTSLGQLKDILRDQNSIESLQMISGIDQILFRRQNPALHQRVDLFLYTFETPNVVQYPPTRFSQTQKSSLYTANRKLQTVELHFPNVMSFIEDLYNNLYVVNNDSL